MKNTIRIRFTLGMIFLFLIILILSVFSGYYLNKLSNKTGAILKENYLSVVYAREMAECIRVVNQEFTISYLSGRNSDSTIISNELEILNHSLQLEKNNITEQGEAKLASDIESGFSQYKKSIMNIADSAKTAGGLLLIQNISGELNRQLLLLSEMNGKAIEVKTDDAKAFSKRAFTRMTILATLCFLIGMSFTFSFASWFNQRFSQLYSGIKEIVSSNYSHRLFFDGSDEFHEISLLVNEMADKLKNSDQKKQVILPHEPDNSLNMKDAEELKNLLINIKTMEEKAARLLSRFENK